MPSDRAKQLADQIKSEDWLEEFIAELIQAALDAETEGYQRLLTVANERAQAAEKRIAELEEKLAAAEKRAVKIIHRVDPPYQLEED